MIFRISEFLIKVCLWVTVLKLVCVTKTSGKNATSDSRDSPRNTYLLLLLAGSISQLTNQIHSRSS